MRVPDPHDPILIAKSGEFVAINFVIDHYRDSLLRWQHVIKEKMRRLVAQTHPDGALPRVNTRTSIEDAGRDEIPLLFSEHDLKDITECMEFARQDERTIGELQRYKLRLLNDHDFTHGDAFGQFAVFGPPPAAEGQEPGDFFIYQFQKGDRVLVIPQNPEAARHLESSYAERRPYGQGIHYVVNGVEAEQHGRGFCFGKQTKHVLARITENGYKLRKAARI